MIWEINCKRILKNVQTEEDEKWYFIKLRDIGLDIFIEYFVFNLLLDKYVDV